MDNSAEQVPWNLFVGSKSFQRILVVGSGSGYSTLGLARHFNEVYVFDKSYSGLKNLKQKTEWRAIQNIKYFCGAASPILSFKSNQFDAVFFDVESSKITDSSFLPEARRVLKKTGVLYFSASNKLSYRRLTGIKDKIICKFRPQKQERESVSAHTIYRYKKALKNAGFVKTKIFSLSPEADRIHTIEDIEHAHLGREAKRKSSTWAGGFRQFLKHSIFVKKYMADCLGIFAQKTEVVDHTIDCIISEISECLNIGVWKISDPAYQVTQKGVLVFKLKHEGGKKRIIVKVSLNSVAKGQLVQNYSQILLLHEKTAISSNLKTIIPKPVRKSSCNNYPYFSEELKEGDAAVEFCDTPEVFDRILMESAKKILLLHSETKVYSEVIDSCLKEIIHEKIGKLYRLSGPEYKKSIPLIHEYLKKELEASKFPMVFHKGDCSAHNIIVLKDYSVNAFIDWDQSLQYGFPFVDLINLIESFKRHAMKMGMGKVLTQYLFPGEFSILEKELVSQYCRKMELSKKTFFPMCIVYWLEHVTAQDLSHDENWMKTNIYNVLEYLEEVI